MGLTGLVLQKSVRIEFDAEFVCQSFNIRRRIQSDGQHHHIEFFFFYSIIGRGVSYGYILGFRDLFSYRYVASDKPNPGKVLRSLVESFEILPVGTDIVMEYRALGLRVMVFCQNHLFLGIGAAYGRTIAVAARDTCLEPTH